MYNINRFIKAQEGVYNQALAEIRQGYKRSHWMWFVFPQVKGLGRSGLAEYYGISSLDEAKEYLADETLGRRLREIAEAFYELDGNPRDILGSPDHMKLKSCMTLFDLISPDDIFNDVLEKFYQGKRCHRTLNFCSTAPSAH